MGEKDRPAPASENTASEKLNPVKASQILEQVFAEVDAEPNTVPVEALTAYQNYRRPGMLRRIAAAAAAILLLAVILLLAWPPSYTVTSDGGPTGMPVYTIRVSGPLPVRSVTASLDGQALLPAEAGKNTWEVSPDHNGALQVKVTLFNYRDREKTVQVTDVDLEAPELLDGEETPDGFILTVRDTGCGLDPQGTYALGLSGSVYFPDGFEDTGSGAAQISFVWPGEEMDIYVSDKAGNELRLSVTAN